MLESRSTTKRQENVPTFSNRYARLGTTSRNMQSMRCAKSRTRLSMSDRRIYRFRKGNETSRRLAAARCMEAPDEFICIIDEPKKSREQEEKYHAMIADIAKCCTFMGREWHKDDWKRMLIDAFVRVMREQAKAEG